MFLYFAKKEDLLVHLFHRDIDAVEEEMFAGLPTTLAGLSASPRGHMGRGYAGSGYRSTSRQKCERPVRLLGKAG